MAGRDDHLHPLGQQRAEAGPRLHHRVPVFRLLVPAPVERAEIVNDAEMRGGGEISEAEARSGEPAAVVEEVIEIVEVLGRDPHFPQRYVLFGEWLAATHSVAYTRLPDWFLAFDMYDRTTQSWVDRWTLEALLADTVVKLVPILYQGPMPAEDELRSMMQKQSRFTDGRLEGVYVKVERDGRVVGRGKVVRSDFIAGNEHWTKGPLQANEVIHN